MMRPGDPRHGTDRGYGAGCREACCRAGHAARRMQDRTRPRPLVDALGTQRRIEALACLGWDRAILARRLGRTRDYLTKVMGQRWLQQDTAEAIAALYDELRMQPPLEGPGATRTINLARRRGAIPPSAWWGLDIDNPAALPAGAPPSRHPDGYRCASCGRIVHLLVDDGDLCIRCDLLHFPLSSHQPSAYATGDAA